MNDVYIKKYWEEEGILFYIHFLDGIAVRQIEISKGIKKLMSRESWFAGGDPLCDSYLEELELDGDEYITALEFEEAWGNNIVK